MARRLIMAAAFCAASVPYAAHAACDAANQFTYSFLTAPVASLSYTGSSTYTATNSLGQSISFTVTYAANGLSTNMAGGVAMPAISNLINSTGSGNNLMIGGIFLGRTTSITGTTRTIKTTLTFATTVRDVRVMVNDVDYGANQFRDWMHASGTGPAGAYVPAITTPYTNNNTTGPRSHASSTLTLGAATTPYPITANQAVGTAVSSNTALNGTMYTAWTQPITSAAITYGNYPYAPGENTTGQQAIGIESVQFCPMPVLTVLKSSAPVDDPVNGTTNPKMVPGAHVDYTLTVTNTGGSPVDAGAVVLADVLPAGEPFEVPVSAPQPVAAAPQEVQPLPGAAVVDGASYWLFTGLHITLFRDDAEGLFLNLESPSPCCWVFWRADDEQLLDGEPMAVPQIATLSYHDAGRWLDAQERVDQVPASAAVVAWLAAYVESRYRPEPKRRQRPASFQPLADRFGNPVSISTGERRGRGRGGDAA